MNNGKVRIYELSKELNLENKDILAVCDSLNISVKSHSSTITESDAQRIRKTAEKLSHSPGKSAANDRGNLQLKDSHSHAGERKKQEIIEIRRPKAQEEKTQNQLQDKKIVSELVELGRRMGADSSSWQTGPPDPYAIPEAGAPASPLYEPN